MIRSEIRRVIRDGGLILIVSLLVGAAARFTAYGDYLAPAMEVFLLLYASFTGWAVFERERQDGALEFMLALPVSRLRLLALKALPRLLAAAAVYGAYLLVGRLWRPPFYFQPGQMLLFYLVFFCVSFSLSLSFRNFITAFGCTVLLSLGGVTATFLLDGMRPVDEAYRLANLPLLALPLLFVFLFRRFDLRPIRRFNLRLLPAGVAAAVLLWGVFFLSGRSEWGCHFLTSAGGIVRSDCAFSRHSDWIDAAGRVRRLEGSLHLLREWHGHLYFERVRMHADLPRQDIVVADSWSDSPRVVYTPAADWQVDGGFSPHVGAATMDAWFLVLRNQRSGARSLLRLSAGGVREIPLTLPLDGERECRLFHARTAPLRLYIWDGGTVYEAGESGAGRPVYTLPAVHPTSRRRWIVAAWKNHLVLDVGGIVRTVDLDDGREILPAAGDVALIPARGPKAGGDLLATRIVLLRRRRGGIWLLDMETLERREAPVKLSPYLYHAAGDRLWIVDKSSGPAGLTIWELRDGAVAGKSEWKPGLAWMREAVSPAGVILWNPRRFEVFRFGSR